MKLSMKIFNLAVIAVAACSIIGCAAPSSFNYSNVTVTLTPQCTDCYHGVTFDPQNPGVMTLSNIGNGGTIVYTAAVTNAPPNLTWSIYPSPNLIQPPVATGSSYPPPEATAGGGVGTIAVASGNTAIYSISIPTGQTSAPIPIYTGAALAQANSMQYVISYQTETVSPVGVTQLTTVNVPTTGIPQGNVLLAASVPNNPDNPSSVATGYQLMEYYNANPGGAPTMYMTPSEPTSPAGLTDSVLSIQHSSVKTPNTYQFYGGAAGEAPCFTCSASATPTLLSVDNTVLWEVGATTATAVVGGNATVGTISTTGLYTAPNAVPTPAQVVVILASHANPSATKQAYITIY